MPYIENKNSMIALSYQFSVGDLVPYCIEHIHFLQYMHESGYSQWSSSYENQNSHNKQDNIGDVQQNQRSLHRYLNFWLPLLLKQTFQQFLEQRQEQKNEQIYQKIHDYEQQNEKPNQQQNQPKDCEKFQKQQVQNETNLVVKSHDFLNSTSISQPLTKPDQDITVEKFDGSDHSSPLRLKSDNARPKESPSSSSLNSSLLPELLLPPPDIAWLWHCHRLAPAHYKRFIRDIIVVTFPDTLYTIHNRTSRLEVEQIKKCQKQIEQQDTYVEESLAKSVADYIFLHCPTNPFFRDYCDTNDAVIKSIDIWNEAYPNEPYYHRLPLTSTFLPLGFSHARKKPGTSKWLLVKQQQQPLQRAQGRVTSQTSFTTKLKPHSDPITCATNTLSNLASISINYDLIGSARRQVDFYWSVCLDQYLDEEFIQTIGLDNYKRFLHMKRLGTNFMIVPTFPIDLVWHTHILKSIAHYDSDCINIIGMLLNHDDNVGDRNPESNLIISYEKTAERWKELYNDSDYKRFGGYRGTPPRWYYRDIFAPDCYSKDCYRKHSRFFANRFFRGFSAIWRSKLSSKSDNHENSGASTDNSTTL